MAETITRYADFWPFYLREHAKPATRYWHFLGTALAIGLAVAALASQVWWLLIGAPIAGYAFAWISHMTIEKNRPATFTYPTWSLVSDFRMFFLWVGGRLGPHLARAGVSPYNP